MAIVNELVIYNKHKDANKEMKNLIDLLKVIKKEDEPEVFIDLSTDTWYDKFNNTLVEVSLESITSIIDGIHFLLGEITSYNRYFYITSADVLKFRLIVDAPKKDFDFVSILVTDNEDVIIRVGIISKVTGARLSEDLILHRRVLVPEIIEKCNRLKGYVHGTIMANTGENHSSPVRKTIIMEPHDIELLNGGDVINVVDNDLNIVVVRMLKNILYRTIKDDKLILDYVALGAGDVAYCSISYDTYSSKNTPIKIYQYFSVFTYTNNTEEIQ